MNHFTIKDIENLCGIKAHTIRTWEQRYKLCVAKRKESQHRVYTNEDLKELLKVSFLYHNGYKISKIAELSPEGIHQVVCDACACENTKGSVFQLIEAGIDLDKEKFDKLVNCLVNRLGLEKCITEIFFPFLQRIGLLWITNNVIPAQEHFVSHIIRKKIILAIDGLEPASKDREPILVFAPEGEHHEIPLLAINYFLRKNNNATIYFGPNVSLKTLAYYLELHPVSYIYAHVITQINNQCPDHFIREMAEKFPGKKILLSGPAMACLENLPAQFRKINSFEEMIAFAKTETISALHNYSHLQT